MSPAISADDRERARILIVDDEEENRQLYCRILSTRYEVLTARDGKDALEQLARGPVDLVICDQRMPGLAGAAVLEQVRSLWPDARRMIISAFAAADDLLEAINRGEVERYLTKPFDPSELLLAAEEVLSELRRHRAASAELVRLRGERDRLRRREDELVRLNAELASRLEAQLKSRRSETEPVAAGSLPTLDQAKATFSRELKRAARYHRPLSLVLARLGPPPAPAAVIQRFAELLSSSVREIDVCARLDELGVVVLLPETDRDGASRVGERFVDMAARAASAVGEPAPSVHHAVASFPADGLGLWGLLSHAGRGLGQQ